MTLEGLAELHESELLQWVRDSVSKGKNVYSYGYQGHVYLYEGHGHRLIVKAPTGLFISRIVRRAMLRNEARIYAKLAGLPGVPRCYGFLGGAYLVL